MRAGAWMRGLVCLGGGSVLAVTAVFALSAPAASAAAAPARLEHATLHDAQDRAELTLTVRGAVVIRYFHLRHPDRLVIDLLGTRREGRIPRPRGGGLVSGLHTGVRRDGLRLVLVLREPVHAHYSNAGGPRGLRRLRFELEGADRPAARAARTRPAPAGALHAVHAVHEPRRWGREVIVAVDPGHGGVDPGATGKYGTHEKTVTLAIGRDLASLIDHARGMHAVLTRTGDYFVSLRERRVIARRAHANLFVSIHADAVYDRAVEGASVYVLSERGASSVAARRLAEQENAADLRGGISLAHRSRTLRSVLLNLSQNATISQSDAVASKLLASLDGVGALRKQQVQHAAFVVLKSPDIPSVLIETDYISDPVEELKLRSPRHQWHIAEAILRGIKAYFLEYPPRGSYFARVARVRHELADNTAGALRAR